MENQAEVIETYAGNHGFSVIHTYSDSARTGVTLRKRKALQQLIQDVLLGVRRYKAILVYDVSRWGRFQDTDEAAHYEFLCKSVGVPVHYCAENFSNDSTLPNLIMKSLKRAMAGEYSRELGVKVLAGQQKLVQLGFRQGGPPGYGLRRLLVSAEGRPKQRLRDGERKSIASDRVILIPGPVEEVNCVRDIYEMFVRKKMTFASIARELNRRGIEYIGDSKWNNRAVHTILMHPKYAGFNVYGRSSQRLYTPTVQVPRSAWTLVPGAFEALVDPATYEEAQRTLANRPRNQSDNDLLAALRDILGKEGRLTTGLIANAPDVPSPNTYRKRFGALSRAYELIGYDTSWNGDSLQRRRHIQVLRNKLMGDIVSLSCNRVSIENRGPTFRTRLRLRNGRLVSVLAARCIRAYKGAIRWVVKPVRDECRLVAVVARLNAENSAFKDLFVIPPLGGFKGIIVTEDDLRLNRGVRLCVLGEFLRAVQKVSAFRKRASVVRSAAAADSLGLPSRDPLQTGRI